MPRPVLQVLLALSLVLAANYFWDPGAGNTPDADTRARQEALPRTYIKNVRTWSFDENGQLNDIVEAILVEQFPQRKQSLITEPRFYAHSENDKTWSASAKRGTFFHGGERLALRDTVVLNHDQTGTRMESNALNIELRKRIAWSKRKVVVTHARSRTTANGMLAELDRETIQLKPKVESIYVKPPAPALP